MSFTTDEVLERFKNAKRVSESDSSSFSIGSLFVLFFTAVAILLVFIIPFAYFVFATGYVTKVLWAWFITPQFNLPLLTLGQAFGIAFFTRFLTYQHIDAKPPERTAKENWGRLFGLACGPWFVLLFGWIAKYFIL